MKALFIGGVKSGKSLLAEEYTIKNAQKQPFYLATTEFIDEEMFERIGFHKAQRKEQFITIEEPLDLITAIAQTDDIVLVECLSMWINNMLYHGFDFKIIEREITKLLKANRNIVFVLNDVGTGVIPDNALARNFVDISGKVSQIVARECDEVFHVIAGIGTKIK